MISTSSRVACGCSVNIARAALCEHAVINGLAAENGACGGGLGVSGEPCRGSVAKRRTVGGRWMDEGACGNIGKLGGVG